MKRIIEVKVSEDYLTKDGDQAGTQYEANVTTLRITFDESWDGFAKKVLFWDAKGENPVRRILTVDMLENVDVDLRVYLCPIPGEALTEAGWCEFVVEGYADGKRQRTVADKLKVRPAPHSDTETEPIDPTPSQAEQLQVQMDAILVEIQRAIHAADAADAAMARAESAQQAAEEAILEAGIAQEMMETGTHAARHADGGEDQLTPEMIGAATTAQVTAAQSAADDAQVAADVAHAAAGVAQTTADNAQNTADNAQIAANNAQGTANAAQTAANNAQSTANSAATAAANANANANGRVSKNGDTIFGQLKVARLDVTDYAQPLEAPQYIDYHIAGSTADYDARLSIDANKELWYERYGIGSGRVIHEGMITKSTYDIGEGVAMVPGGFYVVYE